LGSRIPGFRGTSEVTKNNKESKRLLERIIAKMRILISFEKSSKYCKDFFNDRTLNPCLPAGRLGPSNPFMVYWAGRSNKDG
jgi:hypothetical protein